MAKRKIKPTDISDEQAVEIVKAWIDFKDEFIKFFSNITGSSVELAFESSLDEHVHFHFDTDEAVYVSDVIVSPKGEVRFVVPYGAHTKSFSFKESELIKIYTPTGEDSLDNCTNKLFTDKFKHTQIKTIPDLEKILSLETDRVKALFNHPEEFISAYDLKLDREKKYSKLPNYGLF